LAIRFAIETLPPFLMAGARFVVAGGVLYGWARRRGAARPTRFHWRAATVVGGLMLLGGNGGVVWAEQRVFSSLAALMIATVPLWMALLDWVRPGGVRPGNGVVVGLALGFAGVVLLATAGAGAGDHYLEPAGAIVLVLAALSWSIGSLYSRGARLPASPFLATAMEMLMGGALLLVVGLLTGEWTQLGMQVSFRSFLALGYLIVFGSIVAFTAYIWLLRVTTPARASTYAYVNPVVAVLLGWALGNEPLTPRTLLAAAVIIVAVVFITTYRARGEARHAAQDVAGAMTGQDAAVCDCTT
jgi:drug/metabolite transporter (DMT)-like permease